MKWKHYLLAAWLVTPLAGCASLNDSHYELTQKSRARAAFRCVKQRAKQHCYPKDYECGWKDGFYDVATGGKGCPPVVAPKQYWCPDQILEDCDNRRLAYYDGFQDGATCAQGHPDTHYLKMWSSCECPLPVCESCCPAGSVCPTGSCGFSMIPEDGFVKPIVMDQQPAASPSDVPPYITPKPPADEVVPPAPELPAPKDAAAKDTAAQDTSAKEPVSTETSEKVAVPEPDDSSFHVIPEQDAVAQTTAPATAQNTDVQTGVWIDWQAAITPTAIASSVKTTESSKPQIIIASPINFAPLITNDPIGSGMIDQGLIELAQPLSMPGMTDTAKPVVQMAEGMTLPKN